MIMIASLSATMWGAGYFQPPKWQREQLKHFILPKTEFSMTEELLAQQDACNAAVASASGRLGEDIASCLQASVDWCNSAEGFFDPVRG
jgi:hypothetical protein